MSFTQGFQGFPRVRRSATTLRRFQSLLLKVAIGARAICECGLKPFGKGSSLESGTCRI